MLKMLRSVIRLVTIDTHFKSAYQQTWLNVMMSRES